jgi:hypothetical protein
VRPRRCARLHTLFASGVSRLNDLVGITRTYSSTALAFVPSPSRATGPAALDHAFVLVCALTPAVPVVLTFVLYMPSAVWPPDPSHPTGVPARSELAVR